MKKEINKMAEHGVKWGYFARVLGMKTLTTPIKIIIIVVGGLIAALVGFFIAFILKRKD
jgi:hypothetical protein